MQYSSYAMMLALRVELPIFERTNIIAQCGGARGLYAAEYCLLFLFCHFIYITSMISPVHIKILYFI